jgi:hypothetical protein
VSRGGAIPAPARNNPEPCRLHEVLETIAVVAVRADHPPVVLFPCHATAPPPLPEQTPSFPPYCTRPQAGAQAVCADGRERGVRRTLGLALASFRIVDGLRPGPMGLLGEPPDVPHEVDVRPSPNRSVAVSIWRLRHERVRICFSGVAFTSWRRSVCERFVRSITIAHRLPPDCPAGRRPKRRGRAGVWPHTACIFSDSAAGISRRVVAQPRCQLLPATDLYA